MKGKTNNPNGRPKGVPNKRNIELRQKIAALIDHNWNSIQSDIEGLEPRDRLSFLEKLMSYTLPKLQSIQVEGEPLPEGDKTVIVFTGGINELPDYKSMNDDELRAIIAHNEKLLIEL